MANWTYRTDGDYTHFRAQFDEVIQKYCGESGKFEVGVSSFGDDSAISVFNSLSRPSTAEALRDVLRTNSLSSYLGGKAAWIAFCAFAVLYFIVCCVLSAGLNAKFRRCCANKCGMCRDRGRSQATEDNQRKKVSWAKFSSVLILLILLGLSITAIIYAAKIGSGHDAMTCDFWLTMKAHYFGVDGMQLAPGVVSDWKGSASQFKMMKAVAEEVNPKTEPTCPMCEVIWQRFNGTEDALKPALTGSRDDVMKVSDRGAYLLYTLRLAFQNGLIFRAIKPFEPSGGFGTQIGLGLDVGGLPAGGPIPGGIYAVRFWAAPLVERQLARYGQDLDSTTNDGVELFDYNLNSYLDANSTVLYSSHGTAMASIAALVEVDAVMAGLIELWEESLTPLMGKLLAAAEGLGIAISTLFLITVIFGFVLYHLIWKSLQKGEGLSAGKVRSTSAMYVLLVLLSGLTLIVSAAMFLIGSVGRDGCLFMDRIAFEEGNWQLLPPKLWNSTTYTNIPTVLDTCVKETGDGMVSSALGIDMLLTKLKQGVVQSEATLREKVEAKLNLKVKEEKTAALVQLTKGSHQEVSTDMLVYGCRAGSEDQCVKDYGTGTPDTAFDKYRSIKPFLDRSFKPYIGSLGDITIQDTSSIAGAVLNGLPQSAATLIARPVITTTGIDSALEGLREEVLKELQALTVRPSVYTEFCLKAMISEPTKELYKDYQCCDENKLGCLIVDSQVKLLDPTVNPKLRRTLDLFKEKGLYGKRYEGAYSMIYQFILLDAFLRYPLNSSPFKRRQTEPKSVNKSAVIPTTIPYPQGRQFFHIHALHFFFPEIVPNPLPTTTTTSTESSSDSTTATSESTTSTSKTEPAYPCLETNSCTLGHAIHLATPIMEGIGERLLEAYNVANGRIQRFVNETIDTFKGQLAEADKGLEDFNCQIVGTAMKEGVEAGLCKVILPSIAFVALITVMLWVVSAVGAFVSWKIYHYCRDLADNDAKGLMAF